MIIEFNKSVLMKDSPLPPGWYKVTVSKIHKLETRKGVLDQPVTFAFEREDLAVDERDVDHTFFNFIDKGIGFTVAYAAAILGRSRQELADEVENGEAFKFDFDESLGKKLQIKIINTEYQGRIQNKVDGFLPYDTEVAL